MSVVPTRQPTEKVYGVEPESRLSSWVKLFFLFFFYAKLMVITLIFSSRFFEIYLRGQAFTVANVEKVKSKVMKAKQNDDNE